MSGYKHIRDMDGDLSNESEERLQELLAHWQMMANTSALIRRKKQQREDEQKVRRIKRALKLKQTRSVFTPPNA